jgi:chemotaxis protein CheD
MATKTERLELGELRVSSQSSTVYEVVNIGSGVVVTFYDIEHRIAGIACVILPESKLANDANGAMAGHSPARYADLAIPRVLEEFVALGANKRSTIVRMVGGAQLFNFGGGGGNLLNIGVRNATAVRTALSRQGFAIERADTGGNKGKNILFSVASGQIVVCPAGGLQYTL